MSDKRGPSLTSIPGMPARGPGTGPATRFAVKIRPRNLRRSISRVWLYFKGERHKLVLVMAFVLVDSSLALAGPYLIGRGVDAIAASTALPHPVHALTLAVVSLLAAYLGSALLQTMEGWLMAGISQRMVRNIREGLFETMQHLPLSFYDSQPHGDLMSRLTNDVDAVSVTVSQSAVLLLSGVVVVLGALLIMVTLSPVMAIVSLLPVPLVFLLTSTISRRTRILFKKQQDALGVLNGHVEETVSGIRART